MRETRYPDAWRKFISPWGIDGDPAKDEPAKEEWRVASVDRIPRRFRDATTNRELGDHGLYLHGAPGVGKTYLAAALAKQAVAAGLEIHWASSAGLLAAIQAGFGSNKESIDLSAVTRCDLLVIDDLGAEKPTEWAAATLCTVIDAGYVDDVQMIVTSNYKLSELNKRLGNPRIGSRLAEACDIEHMDGQDRRLEAAMKRRGVRSDRTTSKGESSRDCARPIGVQLPETKP
jgi:DNA replication protein DnaC